MAVEGLLTAACSRTVGFQDNYEQQGTGHVFRDRHIGLWSVPCLMLFIIPAYDQALATQDLHQPVAATSLPWNIGHGPVAAVPPW